MKSSIHKGLSPNWTIEKYEPRWITMLAWIFRYVYKNLASVRGNGPRELRSRAAPLSRLNEYDLSRAPETGRYGDYIHPVFGLEKRWADHEGWS